MFCPCPSLPIAISALTSLSMLLSDKHTHTVWYALTNIQSRWEWLQSGIEDMYLQFLISTETDKESLVLNVTCSILHTDECTDAVLPLNLFSCRPSICYSSLPQTHFFTICPKHFPPLSSHLIPSHMTHDTSGTIWTTVIPNEYLLFDSVSTVPLQVKLCSSCSTGPHILKCD